MASEKQIQANRQNAQKSTGPRTTEGKARVRQNARKHGLRARMTEIVEDEAKLRYFATYEVLQKDLQPITLEEEKAVLDLAKSLWMFHQLKEWEKETYQAYAPDYHTALTKRHLPWRLLCRYKTAVFNRFLYNVETLLILRGLVKPRAVRARQKRAERKAAAACATGIPRDPASQEEALFARQEASLQQMLQAFEQIQALRKPPSQQSQFPQRPFPGKDLLNGKWWDALNVLSPKRRSPTDAMSNLLKFPSPNNDDSSPQETDPAERSLRVMDAWREASKGVLFSSPLLPDEEERPYEVLKITIADQLRPQGSLEFCLLDWILDAFWNHRRLVAVEKHYYIAQRYDESGKDRGLYHAFHQEQGHGFFTRLYRAKEKAHTQFYQAFNAWCHLARARRHD